MDKLHEAAAEYAKASEHAQKVDGERWDYLEAFTKRTGLAAREDHMFSDGCLPEYEALEERAQVASLNASVARERLTEVCLGLYQQ